MSRLMTVATCFGLGCLIGCRGEESVYPPCPFEHVADGFPEIIPLSEEPSADDQEAFDAYWEKRDAIFERALNVTIMANAPQRERDLFSAYSDSRYAEARKLADELLQENPDSLIGLFAMADVEAFAENDIAYALSSIRRARQVVEEMAKTNPRDSIGQEWYIWTLWVEWLIASAMDRSQDVLTIVDRIEEVYAPVPWMKVFALIKLERFDEAKAEIEKLRSAGQFIADADSYASMIEDHLGTPDSRMEVAREIGKRFPKHRLLQNNLGLSAWSNAHYAEAEQAFLASANATSGSMDATPYLPLASILVQQGRFPEALDAIKKAQVDRGEREPYTLTADEASTNFAIATVLLAYNESSLAARFARRAIDSPDRASSSNGTEVDFRINNGLILWTIQKYELEELNEYLSIGSVPAITSLGQLAAIRISMWATKQRFSSDLNDSRLANSVMPTSLGSEVQSWHRFLLLDMVPLGVLEVAISESEKLDDRTWIQAYLKGILAGIQLRKSDYAGSLRLSQESLKELPARAEKVYRAFVEAIAGQAAWRLGSHKDAVGHWTTTLRDFPQAFRLLDIQIPIRLSNDGSDLARRITSTLASSSRFYEDESGCEVIVRSFGDKRLAIEMFGINRSRHLELVVPIAQADGFVETTVKEFHHKFFQPLFELTQGDLGALDGSPVAARVSRDVDQLFADFIGSDEPKTEPEASPATNTK